ncbi:outer membrane lipoprotein carrier protein LolA [Cupriavidus respiraculi]|uniref:outer membrane lipoprotein carrier protein LolA n=1 Tax=Cupriavidus respiraculi TaxID=195930 RepID=UPI001C97D12D|nr:outer membrane lipoprotein carrier protein LolA [Cupriavidus respiraculi]MBY4947500.1 outer membrane lipoprotein carrier protein LolA [Cupriavidus respiraculi]
MNTTRYRAALRLLLVAALAAPAALPPAAVAADPAPRAGSAPAAWGVDQLMAALAAQKSGRARFVETKYLAMLERPVESSGELVFVAPDRLEKRTLSPKPESLTLTGDMMTVERAGRKTVIPLQNFPELAGFIESLRGTLGGNRDALERYYRLSLEGQAARWTLTLTPTEPRMAAAIRTIRIDGAGDKVQSVEIRQADGDRSVMRITHAGAR